MRNLRSNKIILLILILCVPTTILFGIISTNVYAGDEDIPEENYKNEWHWHSDIQTDELIIYEMEISMKNLSSSEMILMSKELRIINITGFKNETSLFGFGNVSRIYGTYNYYNCTSEEIIAYDYPWSDPHSLAGFGYNDTGVFREYYDMGVEAPSLGCIFLPVNGTKGVATVDVDIMADIINKTYLNYTYQMGWSPKFNDYTTDPAKNFICFRNTTNNYFINNTYYDNGTLRSAESSYWLVYGGNPDHIEFNTTMKHVLNYDITDEIEWGVDVGDIFYFDQSSEFPSMIPYQDIKVTISGFNKSLYEVPGVYGSNMYSVFQNVLANISIWDGTQYIPMYTNRTIGSANNFYPVYYLAVIDMFFSVIPTSCSLYDLEFFLDYISINIPYFPFDERVVFQKDGYIWMQLNSSISDDFIDINFDTTNGVLETWFFYANGALQVVSYRKDIPQPWLWSVDIGDIVYFKEINMEGSGEQNDYRATIEGFTGGLVNMTYMNYEYEIPLQPGDPEFQFFYTVNATVDEWNETTGSWMFRSTDMFAVANEYWPAFPVPNITPRLIPLGTTGSNLQPLFDMMTPYYDDITFSNDAIIFTNTTDDKTASIYLDGTEGMITYMGGWFPVGDPWFHMSTYIKNNKTLTSGVPYILQSDFITDITMTIQATTTSPDVEYVYALLSENPVNISLPEGTPLYYMDQLIVNDDSIVGNITMTLTFPSSINLSLVPLHMYGYNMSGTNEWDEVPSEFSDTVIYNYLTNSILIEMPPWGSDSMISAMSAEFLPGDFTLDSDALDLDPDGNFTLTWDFSDRANSYSVYVYSDPIDESNIDSATLLATGITDNFYQITDYLNGTYYFIVVAYNDYGYTLSNCIEVEVAIPPEKEEEGNGGIPGYPLYLLLTFFSVITLIVILKKCKKIK
ncbi:MAG: hypothetical protein ACFFCE_08760 [Promethearchaeota archaeon]